MLGTLMLTLAMVASVLPVLHAETFLPSWIVVKGATKAPAHSQMLKTPYTPNRGVEETAENWIVIHPVNASWVYRIIHSTKSYGSDVYHVLRSTDYGMTWTQLGDLPAGLGDWSLGNLHFGKGDDVIATPSLPQRFGSYLLSRDGGKTWMPGLKDFAGPWEQGKMNGYILGFYQGKWYGAKIRYPAYDNKDEVVESMDGQNWSASNEQDASRVGLCVQDTGPWVDNAKQWLMRKLESKGRKLSGELKIEDIQAPESNIRYVHISLVSEDPFTERADEGWILRSDDRGVHWTEIFHSDPRAKVSGNENFIAVRSICGRPQIYLADHHKLYFSADRGRTKKVVVDLRAIPELKHIVRRGVNLSFMHLLVTDSNPKTTYLRVQALYEVDRD